MNCKKLIRNVKNFPELYDYYDIKYSNQKYRELAWTKIGEEVRQPAKICKKKWLSLRDTYRRVLRKRKEILNIDPTTKPRKWAYEDEISFLIPHFQEKILSKNNEIKFEDVDIEEEDLREDQSSVVSETPENFTVTHFEDNETKDLQSFSEGNSDIVINPGLSGDQSNLVPENLIKFLLEELEDKRRMIKELEEKAKTSAASRNDSFFISITSTVNNFSAINQNLVKSKIFSVVSEMEMKELVDHQTSTI